MTADPLGGFGEGLKIAQYSILYQFRLAKSILAVLAIPIDAADAIGGRDRCRRGRPSQGNRLMKHAVSNQWMKGTLLCDVHSAAQFFFQIDQQSSGEPRRCTRTSLDQ